MNLQRVKRMTKKKCILLSIRPHHAKNIFAGTKTVELRRTKPPVNTGDIVVVYASSPTMATIGEFTVKKIVRAAPHALWEKIKSSAGISRAVYRNYFIGAPTAYGIVINKTTSYKRQVTLQKIQKNWHGFVPPQTFRYLTPNKHLALKTPLSS